MTASKDEQKLSFQPDSFIVKRMIRWFEKDGKELLGEAEINDLNLPALRQVYGLVADDPMYSDYPVETKEQVKTLESFLDFKLNTEAYDYFFECDAVR